MYLALESAATALTLLLRRRHIAEAVISNCKAGDLDLRLNSLHMIVARWAMSQMNCHHGQILRAGFFSQGCSVNSLILETTDIQAALAQLKVLQRGTAVKIKTAGPKQEKKVPLSQILNLTQMRLNMD